MKFSGKISVRAPRESVFDSIKDIEFFASCIEGVQDLKKIDETHYTGVLVTKVAYIQLRFNIELEIARMESPHLIEARVVGAPVGVVGRFKSIAGTTLHEDGDGTVIDYTMDATITGKLGSIGQPVMKSKAKEMEIEFAKRLQAHFAGGSSAEVDEAAAAAETTPRLVRRLLSAIAGFFSRNHKASSGQDHVRGAK